MKHINLCYFEHIIRETLGFLFIQIHFLFIPKQKGILSIYFHNPSKVLFEKILKWFAKNDYKFISVKELEDIIYQKLNTNNLVFLSFDDGWNGNLKLIDSIEKFKVPITIFIPTNAVIDGNFWWEYAIKDDQYKYSGIKSLADFKKLPNNIFKEKLDILKEKYNLSRSCITLDELKKYNNHELVTFGSHTVSHPILIRCSNLTQDRELMESKQMLSNWCNKEIEYLSYPNGDYSDYTLQLAEKCGYKLCFSTNPGNIEVGNVNPILVPRNAINDSGGYYENISKILGIWQKFIK